MTPATRTVAVLSGSICIMMTGFGVVMPIFARKVDALGGGLATLASMALAFGAGHAVFAPVAGILADRVGRRPLILVGTTGFAIANVSYLLAQEPSELIAARAAAGIVTAGLYPAALGVVEDVATSGNRARLSGYLMSGYGAGFVLGPVLGGVLYDAAGHAAPFVVSAVAGALATLLVWRDVPETCPSFEKFQRADGPQLSALPRPLGLFALLLGLDFALTFAFGMAEPQLVVHSYDTLGWSSTQLGATITAYGFAIVAGQTMLGSLSDRVGRRPVLLLGLMLSLVLYVGLASFQGFSALLPCALVAGLGVALVGPALTAQYMDVSSEHARSRVMGAKSAAQALGTAGGPLGLLLAAPWGTARDVFWFAATIVSTAGLASLLGLTLIARSRVDVASSVGARTT